MRKNNVLNNLSWKFAERIAAQLVTVIVSVILARMLTPQDYGIIAIVTIFITFANVFVSDGFGSALIQKKEVDALDYSSVLYFNIIFSTVLYVILFFCAPLIASFYGDEYAILTPVLRVLGLRIIVSAVNSVQQAYVSRKMIFKKFFWSTLTGTLISAIVGIVMAYLGFGVWALVGQYLTNTTVDTVTLALSLRKKPILAFSFDRLKGMIGYGSKILGTSLLITGYQELRALIIGKMYSSEDLAYYDKGRQFPNLIVTNINTSIGAVLFPKMAQEQNDKTRIREITRKSIRFSSYLMCPLMLGLAAVAEPFVKIVLTDQWLPCVTLLQIFCVIYLFQPIHTANMQAIKAIGRSDVYLKLEIVKKVIELAVLLIVMWIGVEAIVISMAILTTAFTFVNAYPNKKLLNYSFKQQMGDILPPVCMSLVMAIIVYFFGKIPMNAYVSFGAQIVLGIIVYFVLSFITKNSELKYFIDLIRRKKEEN